MNDPRHPSTAEHHHLAEQPGNLEESVVHLRRVLQLAAEGDLSVRCVGLPGEMGPVGQALNTALEALSSHVGRAGGIASEITGQSSSLEAGLQGFGIRAERQVAAVAELGRKLQALGARAEEVSHVVEALDDVASDTNILALNAALEAARAGAQSRAFAQVADDVRKLGERAASATKDISAFVHSLDLATAEAVAATDALRIQTEALASAAGLSTEGATELRGTIRLLVQALARVRVPGQIEAELRAALRHKGRDLQRALADLAPLLAEPAAARTPLGDAMRRLMDELQANSNAVT